MGCLELQKLEATEVEEAGGATVAAEPFGEKPSLPLGQAVVGAQLCEPMPPAQPSWPDNMAILLPRKPQSRHWKG